jgi:hypothetical protein
LLIGRPYRSGRSLERLDKLIEHCFVFVLYLSSMGDLTGCGYPTSTSLEVRELTFRNSTRIYFRDRLQAEQSHQLQGCRRRSWPR